MSRSDNCKSLSMTISLSRLAFLATLLLSCYFIKPAASTSRKALLHRFKRSRSSSSDGFRVELRHVDHGKNLTKLELLQRAVVRGNHRLQQLSMATSMANLAETGGIKAPIHPGEGEFLMSLSIGTPPLAFSAILDTGSDLIWTQCNPCVQCYDQPSPIFNPSNSTSYSKLSCSSPLCKALPQPSCSNSKSKSESKSDGFCTYTYEYGDYSTTAGTLASETFTFSGVSVSHIGFGCGDDNEGGGFNQGGGLVGLGRGPLSLVSQLKEPKFSYCLTSMSLNDVVATHDGILLMGSLATTLNNATSSVTTPLTRNPAQPSFYYINLIGITVGKTKLSIPKSAFSLKEDGSGGMIIDSGTTITYLEESAFEALKKELIKSVKLKVADDGASQKTGLELCFKLPAGSGPEVSLPRLVFHFEKADLEIPAENYMMGVAGEKKGDPELLCLAMGSGSGMSVFGNIQQQNMLVLHDLARETLTFAPTNCGGL